MLNTQERIKTTHIFPTVILKIPPQATKPRVSLTAPSMLTLITPTLAKRQKTCIKVRNLPVLVLMSKYFKIEKFQIWLYAFLEVLLEI